MHADSSFSPINPVNKSPSFFPFTPLTVNTAAAAQLTSSLMKPPFVRPIAAAAAESICMPVVFLD